MVTELDDDVNQPADIKTLPLLSEQETIERIFQHIDNRTTDLGDIVWQEPVALPQPRTVRRRAVAAPTITYSFLPLCRAA